MADDDYPAAHSMDTMWFAVDRDGLIALFDSGEPGAVPEAIVEQVGQSDPIADDLEALPILGEPAFELSALLHPGLRAGARPPRRKVPLGYPSEGSMTVLVFHTAPELPQDPGALPGLRVRPIDDGFGLVAVTLAADTPLPRDHPSVLAWIAFVRGAYAGDVLVTATTLFGTEVGMARRGVFFYRAHDERFNAPEPYGLTLKPERPIRLEELPPATRRRLASRRPLDVSFATSRYVQPAELVRCTTWGSALYLASDGVTVRPLPGREAEYEAEASALDADAADDEPFRPVVFDPPLSE